jgi:hypothetical protein
MERSSNSSARGGAFVRKASLGDGPRNGADRGCPRCEGSKVGLQSTDGGIITADDLAPVREPAEDGPAQVIRSPA